MGVALQDNIALVTGASRGIGRGIALQLGEAGATVYITGRRPELSENLAHGLPTLEHVAQEINERGGVGIPVYVDHENMVEVKFLFERIAEEQNGRLDILVNNVYNSLGRVTENIGKPFYDLDPSFWDSINDVGLRNHYYCSVYAAKMMVEQKNGLIVNVASLGAIRYMFNVAYGAGKEALFRMSADMAVELTVISAKACEESGEFRGTNVCVVSLMPGPVKTEGFEKGYFDENGQLKENLPGAKLFERGESAEFAGKALARFAMDPGRMKKNGKTLLTGDLAQKYDFVDREGMDPQNIRSVRTILEALGKPAIARFVPPRIKVPKWLVWQSTNRF